MLDLITIGDIKEDVFLHIKDASVHCRNKALTCELCIDHGRKIPVKSAVKQTAGSAPNIAIGTKRLGLKSAVLSHMGADSIYRDAVMFLREEGVDSLIEAHEGVKSSFAAVLNYEGESTQLVSHEHIPFSVPSDLPETTWLHISELGGDYEDLFSAIAKRDEKIAFNPGTVQIEELKDETYQLIDRSNLLIVNKLEAQQLLKLKEDEHEMSNLLGELRALGSDTVIITDGKKGAYGFDGKGMFHAPMFPGERVEATGAGDAFTTGVLAALISGESLSAALAWGSVDAAYAVQFIGPTAGLRMKEELLALLAGEKDYKVTKL
jgi:sugar/nucleoside kinase (ribokinase family)